ncbi:MAG: polyprenyl synthetase family protein [Prevotella sp.]|nr:polyprenyl synthetase family protein [Prevotella sp.]
MKQYNAEHLCRLVNAYINDFPFQGTPDTLYAPIRYVLSGGGKRMRPVLLLLAYSLYKEDVEAALGIASSIETYHNYTLLHDDLMDKSDCRRGRLTVHKMWGENAAILSGDTMLVLAYDKLIAGCGADKLGKVLALFTKTALEIGEGQQFDMDFEERTDVTEAEYVEMIRLKTSVLLACSMSVGAMLAGAPEEDVSQLYRLGECVGLAFQLQDDYLDVYGDAAVFGKPIGGDICNNKKTYMLINALSRGGGGDKAALRHWIEAKQFDAKEKIAAVTDIYNRLGIDILAKEKIDFYFREANNLLDGVRVEENRKAELRAYINSLRDRQV